MTDAPGGDIRVNASGLQLLRFESFQVWDSLELIDQNLRLDLGDLSEELNLQKRALK